MHFPVAKLCRNLFLFATEEPRRFVRGSLRPCAWT